MYGPFSLHFAHVITCGLCNNQMTWMAIYFFLVTFSCCFLSLLSCSLPVTGGAILTVKLSKPMLLIEMRKVTYGGLNEDTSLSEG